MGGGLTNGSQRERKGQKNEGLSFLSCVLSSSHSRGGLGRETQLMRHLVENVPVQGPEICFPKSRDFAQQPAYWFLEERTDPEPLPLSSCAHPDRSFLFASITCFARPPHVDLPALGVGLKI